jgi:nucleoside-diphosphate-sugar epimerase
MLQSAVDMERLVQDAMSVEKLPAVILRLGTLYSHDSAHAASMFNLISKKRFPVIGDGSVYWNMIHADDAAAAIARTVERAEEAQGGIFNICDDEPVRHRDLVNHIAGMFQM